MVVSRCGCGCPTIDLSVDGSTTPSHGPSEIVADFYGNSPEGVPICVLVHVRDGKLSELEVYSADGS